MSEQQATNQSGGPEALERAMDPVQKNAWAFLRRGLDLDIVGPEIGQRIGVAGLDGLEGAARMHHGRCLGHMTSPLPAFMPFTESAEPTKRSASGGSCEGDARALGRRRRGDAARAGCEHGEELAGVDGLGEVGVEAFAEGAGAILDAGVGAEGERGDGAVGPNPVAGADAAPAKVPA